MGHRMGASSRRDRDNSMVGAWCWRAGGSLLSEIHQVYAISSQFFLNCFSSDGKTAGGRLTLLSLQIIEPWVLEFGSLFQDAVSAWGCKHLWCDFELLEGFPTSAFVLDARPQIFECLVPSRSDLSSHVTSTD